MQTIDNQAVQFYDVKGPYGKQNNYSHQIKINGDKYSFFNPSDQPKANKGDKVYFAWEQNDKGFKNIDPQTFKVVERGSVPSNSGTSYPKGKDYGIEVGHAINNAVHWLASTQQTFGVTQIEEHAGEIFRLSAKMKEQAVSGELFQANDPSMPQNNAQDDKEPF